MDGNTYLVESLTKIGIKTFFGVNGGGLIYVTNLLESFSHPEEADDCPRMFTIYEYVAGFCPIGYYLASKQIACVITTTGAASQLALPGLSDCKFMNIPALYLVALNSTISINRSPLQDVTPQGINIVDQIKTEIGSDCYVISGKEDISDCMAGVYKTLSESRPAALCFHPDILSQPIDIKAFDPPTLPKKDPPPLESVIDFIKINISQRRFIIYVGLEASLYPKIQESIDKLSKLIKSPIVWSVNGANAVNPDNPYGYGFIMLGGNEASLDLWNSLNENDVLICLGFDSGEYSLGLENIPVGDCFIFTNYEKAYASIDGTFKHRIEGNTTTIYGRIDENISYITAQLNSISPKINDAGAPTIEQPRVKAELKDPDCVDLYDFYQKLMELWRPNSLGFDDVCTAYRDRQNVQEKPLKNIEFYTAHDGSAMGSAFGLAIGAKIARPKKHIFLFSGDGCWRLYGGALAEAAHLGINLFLFNNHEYSIVSRGLDVIIPDIQPSHKHCELQKIDFQKVAEAMGWRPHLLKPDLSNLQEILDHCYNPNGQSNLIEMKTDTYQVLGSNPRYKTLDFFLK